MGGSLGAGPLNDAALDLYDRWRDRDDVAIRLVCGRRNEPECRKRLTALRRAGDVLAFELLGYDNEMEALYATAALLVCRAGAVTVAELSVTGTPAVFVPLANAPDDHQTKNAQALVGVGAAVLIAQQDLTGAGLAECLDSLINGGQLEQMSAAARTLARPDAAARVATLVEEVAGAAA